MKINILGGSGLMGKIHKPLLESAGHEVIISGRSSPITLEDAARNSDLTIVSVPLLVTEETIKKVAPYANALMDFTSLKENPIKTMLEYSKENCEVEGLHPLYGEINSINGRTIIACETSRTGEKCREVISAFEKAGAKIIKMRPRKHDYIVQGILQNSRTILLEGFGKLLNSTGIPIEELYAISPPPTRALIDLLARQVDEKNDSLYSLMRGLNPSQREIEIALMDYIAASASANYDPFTLRKMFGENLKLHQEKAKKIINP